MPHQIVLAGFPNYPPEQVCSVLVTPGMLIEPATGGDAGKVKPHATAGGNAEPRFAIEALVPDLAGTTEAVSKNYAIGDSVRQVWCKPGDLIWAWLPANAVAVVIGDYLESNGAGYLRKYTAQSIDQSGTGTVALKLQFAVAQAAEAINNSAGSDPVRIKVRIL